MRKIYCLLFVFVSFSCTKTVSSNISPGNSIVITNTENINSVVNVYNQNLTNQSNSTASNVSETSQPVNTDLLRQIQNQQMETADPRKAVNKNTNTNQPAKKSAPAGRQTW